MESSSSREGGVSLRGWELFPERTFGFGRGRGGIVWSHVTDQNRSRSSARQPWSDMAADPISRGPDLDVRPPKRPKLSATPAPMSRLPHPSCSSPLTPLSSPPEKPILPFRPLPLPFLLLSLPAILILPPNHPLHDESLRLSVVALRRCLLMKALSPEMECRAWTTLAQVGLQVIGSRLSASPHERHAWARNIDAEVRTTKRSPWVT